MVARIDDRGESPQSFAVRADAARAAAARDARLRSGCGTFGSVCGFGGHGAQRPHRARAARASSRASAAACARSSRASPRSASTCACGSRSSASARSRARPRRWSARARRSRSTRARPRTTSRSSCARSASSSSSRTACSSRPRSPTRPAITVLVTGGMLRLSAMSLVGDLGTDVLRTTRINKGFLGARGLSLERGLMDLNPDEVRIKQEMADACEQVYRDPRRHEVAPQRAALVRPDRASSPGSSPTRARPRTRSQAWRAARRRRGHRRPGPRRAAAAPAARPPPRGPQRRRRELMATLRRRRPRRAERPRRRRPLRRRAARRRPRCTGSRTSPVRAARHAALGRAARSTRDVLDGLRAAGARGGAIDSVARRLVGRRLRPARPRRAACSQNPVHYRDARRAARDRARARAGARARALRAHRHPADADQHGLRARRDGGRATIRRSRPPRRCC